jgi:signal transduction histidine kinase
MAVSGTQVRAREQRPPDPVGEVLPRWHADRYRFLRVLVLDLAAPALVAGLAVHDLLYNGAGPVAWALAMLTIWPLVLRRFAPTRVFVVCLAALLLICATDSPSFAGFALLPALYTVAAHRSFRRSLVAAVALELAVIAAAVEAAPARSVDDAIVLLSALAFAALFLGTTLRTQRRYLASLEDRARRLEREREQQAQLAVTAERTRIAREMHDVVAHGLSVVITLAEGAATRTSSDPETARAAMKQVAAAGRQSLGEMRRLLDVLRTDEDTDRAPQPGLSALDALVDDVRATGMAVDVHQEGELDRLDPTVQLAIYRAVQEGLTNVLKHARGATRVFVEVVRDQDAVRFAVRDDGRATPPSGAPGSGLQGMRERLAMFDGTIEAGPSGAGWTVSGRLHPGDSS